MEDTQLFRLIGKMDIEEITCDNVDGQNIVYWEDIEQVFPGVKHVKNGRVTINMMRDSNRIRVVPHCIKHCPGVVLDVVLSTTAEDVHVGSSMSAPSPAPTDGRADAPTDSPTLTPIKSKVVEVLQVALPLGCTPTSDITFSTVPTTLSPSPLSSPSGVMAASKSVLSNSTSLASTIPPKSLMSLNESVNQLNIKSEVSVDLDPSEPLRLCLPRKSTMQIQEDMKVATDALIARNRAGKPLDAHSVVEENLPPEYRESITTLMTVARELEVLHDQGHTTQQIVRQVLEEAQQIVRQVLEEAQQIKDRLILIERKTAAILTQNYELLEYTIPRLFIVLPEASTSWNPKSMLRTKFRLHFICECGEHTMPAAGSKIPHHLHLANHEGYVIDKPTEFFKKYGPFLMLMLEMIKLGTGIAGHVVPALASLKVVDVLDSAQSTIDSVTSKVIQGVDYSLNFLEANRTLIQNSDCIDVDGNASASHQDLASYLAGVEGLEGVDLRQLGSYLAANSSDNLLGNLYRMTTKDGHVKWVCCEHYQAGLHEECTQKLRDVVKLAGGKFDEQLGRIEISLTSSFATAEFYDAVRKAKGVLDLDVSFHWNQERADFVKFKDMISKSKIRLIKLSLGSSISPSIDTDLRGIQQYDPFFEIIRLPFIDSFEIAKVPEDFFKRSNLLPKKADLSHLRHLGINGQWTVDRLGSDLEADIIKLKLLVSKATNLTSLFLDTTTERLPVVFSSIAEYQTYPIDFVNLSLRLTPPLSKSHQSKANVQDLEHFCKVYGAQFETLDLNKIGLDNLAMEALAKATQRRSSLKEVTVGGLNRNLGDRCIKAIATIIAQCGLRKLRLALEKEDARVRILESIPWKYIRDLEVIHEREAQEVGVLKALVDGIQRTSGRIELERLDYTVRYTQSIMTHAPTWNPPTRQEAFEPVPIFDEVRTTENEAAVQSAATAHHHFRLPTLFRRRIHRGVESLPMVLSADQEDLLRSTISSLSVKHLALSMIISLDQVLGLFKSADFSRLEYFSLSIGFLDRVKVQIILDSLQHATELRTIDLYCADITNEQKEQMFAKGIKLLASYNKYVVRMAPQHDIHIIWPYSVPSGKVFVAGTWSISGDVLWEKLPMIRVPGTTDQFEVSFNFQEIEDISDYLDDDGNLHHELLSNTSSAPLILSKRQRIRRFFGRTQTRNTASTSNRDLHVDLPYHHHSKDGGIALLKRGYRYQYKFMIDDEWRCDPNRPQVQDSEGYCHHELAVDLIEQT
ncbi:hypothetical protein BGX21_004015 [Mortierella sp. AD011]|nr:hypothetical protein BGX20_002815 [Mortierella sp. AD010]KAF9400578.1 hypothetical protein BGX21_004015 [Mortierella sp. AD011]